MHLKLRYTPQQDIIFFQKEKGERFHIVTKGRRFGATKGAANAFMEFAIEGEKLLWGDTINSNIDRYVQRYFEPELKTAKIPYNWNAVKKELRIFDGHIDFRSADRPENWEGFGYDRIFLNEAGIILKNDYLYTNAVLPMLMDNPESILIAAGVPKGKFLRNGKKHRFYDLYQSAKEGRSGFRALAYSSYDNPLLDKQTIKELEAEMQRMNPAMVRQEIYGEFVEGASGLLWDEVIIEKARIEALNSQPSRTVIAVDPAVTSTEKSDETGIIVACKDGNGKYALIDDLSGKYSPNEWAQVVASAVKTYSADCIVAEKNQGGDMVESVLRQVVKGTRIKLIHAYKGKALRAEPIFALYQQGKVIHVGHFPLLERQMCDFNPDEKSPDRLDAMVYAVTELSTTNTVKNALGTGGRPPSRYR